MAGQKYGITLRKSRLDAQTRAEAREVRFTQSQLIQPYFAVAGLKAREPVPGLTGVYRETTDTLLGQIESDLENGVTQGILFGVPSEKSPGPKFRFDQTADQIRAVKRRFGERFYLYVDVCLCSHTDHGHCGILNEEGDHVVNEASVEALAQAALEYARAGVDAVAPSDMMDGRVAAIREALDREGFDRVKLMSYSAKFHSRFYGPFRAAADSAPKGSVKLKDRATYQIDPGHPTDAYLSSKRDLEEGADILMVKPGLPYLDVLKDLSARIPAKWAVYEVSGEFAAIEALAAQGMIDGPRAHWEAWTAFFRAGASLVLTYGARHFKRYEKASES